MVGSVFWGLVLIVALIVLAKAADFFIDSAANIGEKLGLPSFVVGVVILGFGTSLPELVSSIIGVVRNNSEIVTGNVIGSNITNILLILGLASLGSKYATINYNLLKYDIPYFVGSTFLLVLMLWDGNFSRGEAILSLVLFCVYTFYSVTEGSTTQKTEEKNVKKPYILDVFIILVSLVAIYFSAEYVVKSVMELSSLTPFSKETLSLTIVALGTSLPEVMVTVKAMMTGKNEMGVGNIIGSNIFNTFFVMSVPSFFGPIVIPDSLKTFSLPMLLIATILAFLIVLDKKLYRSEGIMLLLFYVYFLGNLYGIM